MDFEFGKKRGDDIRTRESLIGGGGEQEKRRGRKEKLERVEEKHGNSISV